MNTFLIRTLNKFNYLESFNLNGTVRLNGKSYKVPLYGKVGLGNLLMNEPWMVDLLKIVLKIEDKTFVDIGVNVGQTLLKLKSVSSSTRYIGFEPNPGCIHYVNKLIKANSLNNIELIPVGVSTDNQIGKLLFYHDNAADSFASIIEEERPNKVVNRREFVPLFNIETIKHHVDLDNISVLKIDVEGAELEVLTSFKALLSQYNPIILMEILPVYNAENTGRLSRQQAIEKIVRDSDYLLFRIVKQKFELADITEIKEIGIHADLKCCDYAIVPKSKAEQFKQYFLEWKKQS